jgi:hypothetical protein
MLELNLLVELSVQADIQQMVQVATEVVKLIKECIFVYILVRKITK